MKTKLHIGSGPVSLPGWVNIDSQPYPGVDRVLDIRAGLPFEGVDAIFAEHFIEHLTLTESARFLGDCRRALGPAGILRLSTPNLDWVWTSHYRPPETLTDEYAVLGCLELNRAFHGWGHRFLYNFSTLAGVLRTAGFAEIVRCSHGASESPDLRNLERHELAPAFAGIESTLTVEASGRGEGDGRLPTVFEPFLRDFDVT